MAITMSRDKLPEVGDVVERIEFTYDGAVAYLYFKSGRWAPVHVSPDEVSALLADKDPTEVVKSG